MGFRLRFPAPKIQLLADQYLAELTVNFRQLEDEVEKQIGPEVRRQGFFTKEQFLKLARWKSPRPLRQYEKNVEEYVREVTRTALSASEERMRIQVLTLLDGVNWPVASVLLHFGAKEQYPILDFRALWSLGVNTPPQYGFQFWWSYVEHCRELAFKYNVPMRTLDRALWQFSKENQEKGKGKPREVCA